MVRKKDNYDLWLKEIKERHRIRNAKRKAKRKAKKNAARTWKLGCLITFKTLDSCRKPKIFICRMSKVLKVNMHSCAICKMINHEVPCLNGHTNIHTKCMLKRPLDIFPRVIGRIDKHGVYHKRIVSI